MTENLSLQWQNFIEQLIDKGAYKTVLSGLLATIEIAVFGLIIGLVLGSLIGIIKVMPKYKTLPRILDKICGVYVAFFRGTPMVVQLLLSYYVVLPLMGVSTDNAVVIAIIVFGLNSGAYISEIMRGGINSVDSGQLEAGRAVGLGYWTSMVKIVIPQAVKNIVPTLGNEFITLVKETSIVNFIAITDLYKAFKGIGSQNYEYFFPYIMLALIYLLLVLLITGLVKLVEKRMKKNER